MVTRWRADQEEEGCTESGSVCVSLTTTMSGGRRLVRNAGRVDDDKRRRRCR